MASFREICFTPAEFASIAKVDRGAISSLESAGLLKTIKKKVGNVDRKMITLEDMQGYFRNLRNGRHGDHSTGATAAGDPIPVTENTDLDSVAAATGFA